MLENLTQRERVLAWLVMALVPISLLFVGCFWFLGRYNDNNSRIQTLALQLSEQQDKLAAATKANQRRIYYRSISLPSNLDQARNDYQQWLKQLIRDEVGMDYRSVTPRPASQIKHDGKLIGNREIFTVLAIADLEQLVAFFEKFYQLDLLHRINSISIIPKTEGATGAASRIRSGELSLSLEVEVLSLVDADAKRDFIDETNSMDLADANWRDMILRRNIFGPANNTPIVTVSKSGSYVSGKDARITLNGKDADSQQSLTFELLDSAIAEAELEQQASDARKAYLKLPGQPEGQYEFTVKVADNGFPPKSNQTEFTVTFKDRKIVAPPPPQPEPPPFEHARETRIAAIVKNNAGDWVVWIKTRTTGETHKLKVGQSFGLDGKDWKVVEILPDRATFEVGGQQQAFKRNQTFGDSM